MASPVTLMTAKSSNDQTREHDLNVLRKNQPHLFIRMLEDNLL